MSGSPLFQDLCPLGGHSPNVPDLIPLHTVFRYRNIDLFIIEGSGQDTLFLIRKGYYPPHYSFLLYGRGTMKKEWAVGISSIFIIFSFVLSIERGGSLGFSINMLVLLIGLLVAALLYLILTSSNVIDRFFIPTCRCMNCGRPMPIDAQFCPYCGTPPGFKRSPPISIKGENK